MTLKHAVQEKADRTNLFDRLGGDVKRSSSNALASEDRAFHDWYRFVLAFPAHLVRGYVGEFLPNGGGVILDPFCGTGTTVVEAKLSGHESVGFEASPIAHLASSVKTDWSVRPDLLEDQARSIAQNTNRALRRQSIRDSAPFEGVLEQISLRTLPPESAKLLIKNSISPLPLHKSLLLLDRIRKHEGETYYHHLLLAFAKTLVAHASNLRFGPEVGAGPQKMDAPVVGSWLKEIHAMCEDLRSVSADHHVASQVFLADSREAARFLGDGTIGAVITSPPYPNEKDYTRTTRLESVLLGFITTREELRAFKRSLIRSNTRGVYKGDDDDNWISQYPAIYELADEIEKRRVALGKTSGFERLYARVTRLYFGGMARHLASLRPLLRPGAMLAYVVGDQASYLRVMIRTGQLLAEIAKDLGYEHVRTDLFRTRFATATKQELREEVLVLRWPGH